MRLIYKTAYWNGIPVLMQENSLLTEADSWDTWMMWEWLNEEETETGDRNQVVDSKPL